MEKQRIYVKKKVHGKAYYKFGYDYYGPFLVCYINWLRKQINHNDVNEVVFASRDGYMMQEAYKRLCNEKKIGYKYLYFSRNSIRHALLCRCNNYNTALRFFSKQKFFSFEEWVRYFNLEDEKQKISEEFDIPLLKEFGWDDLYKSDILFRIYIKYEDTIRKKSEIERKLLKDYLSQNDINGKIAFVDIGWHASMQYYLEIFSCQEKVDLSIVGLYLGTEKRELSGENYGYLYDSDKCSNRKRVLSFFGLLEKLSQGFEGSTIGYDSGNGCVIPRIGRYEFADMPDAIDAIKQTQAGALDFVEKYKNGIEIIKSEKKCIKRMLRVGSNPSLELTRMFSFLFIEDGKRNYYTPQKNIFSYTISEFLHEFSNSQWKCGYMKSAFKLPLPYYVIYKIMKK